MFYVVKKHGLKKAKVFFKIDEEFKKSRNKFFMVEYYNIRDEIEDNGIILSGFKSQTLLNNIAKSDEEIIKDFTSNTRNEVRRARREGASSKFYFSKVESYDFLKILIEEIDIKLTEMYTRKGIAYSSIKELLLEYCEQGILGISIGTIGSKDVAFHIYVLGDSVCRLAYSVSTFREDKGESKIIAMVNRMLHYDDMKYARDLGFTIYDWGGYGQEEDVLSISKFKEGFGGEISNYEMRYVIKKNLLGILYRFYLKHR